MISVDCVNDHVPCACVTTLESDLNDLALIGNSFIIDRTPEPE